MCERCTRAWLPTNHRNSHGFTFFGDKFHSSRIFSIRSPFAELRRKAKMNGGLGRGKYRNTLAETRAWLEKSRSIGGRNDVD